MSDVLSSSRVKVKKRKNPKTIVDTEKAKRRKQFILAKRRGKRRAEFYQELLNKTSDLFHQEIIIFALLGSGDGRTLQKEICKVAQVDVDSARKLMAKYFKGQLNQRCEYNEEKFETLRQNLNKTVEQLVKRANFETKHYDRQMLIENTRENLKNLQRTIEEVVQRPSTERRFSFTPTNENLQSQKTKRSHARKCKHFL